MMQITASYFEAGIMFDAEDYVWHAAPVIAYMLGWPKGKVLEYCNYRGWTIEPCELALRPTG